MGTIDNPTSLGFISDYVIQTNGQLTHSSGAVGQFSANPKYDYYSFTYPGGLQQVTIKINFPAASNISAGEEKFAQIKPVYGIKSIDGSVQTVDTFADPIINAQFAKSSYSLDYKLDYANPGKAVFAVYSGDITTTGQPTGSYSISVTDKFELPPTSTGAGTGSGGSGGSLPDFVSNAEGVSSTSLAPGANVSINGRVANVGTSAAAPGHIGYYLSTDSNITTSDLFLGQINQGSIGAGSSVGLSTQVTLPTNLKAGSYYLGFIADYDNAVAESNQSNNASIGTLITVTNGGSAAKALFGAVTTDPHSSGGQVYALYDGIFGRAPDTLGLEYYADQIAHGTNPASLATNFLASPEGQARFGAVDNTAFVQQLYQNTLHRAADASGLQYHLDELAHGVARVDVAQHFVFSPEHLANLQPTLNAGLFVPDAQAAQVARVYYTMLGRAPDAGGLAYYTDQLDHGGTAASIAQGFLNSPENQATYGKLSNSAYVDALYVNALGRHAEANGLSYWTDQLDHGVSRADLAVSLSQSAEAQNLHLAQIEQGWHLA